MAKCLNLLRKQSALTEGDVKKKKRKAEEIF